MSNVSNGVCLSIRIAFSCQVDVSCFQCSVCPSMLFFILSSGGCIMFQMIVVQVSFSCPGGCLMFPMGFVSSRCSYSGEWLMFQMIFVEVVCSCSRACLLSNECC